MARQIAEIVLYSSRVIVAQGGKAVLELKWALTTWEQRSCDS